MVLPPDIWTIVLAASAAAAVAAVLIVLLRPLLVRYALARPNARSSHREPTPQGGGIAVIGATVFAVAGAALLSSGAFSDPLQLGIVLAATVALAGVGAIDDLRPIDPIPRLIWQGVAVLAVVAALPSALRVLPFLPWGLERALMVVAILWLVNAVNFMDGIDWMTVAEVVPITAGLSLFGFAGALPHDATVVAVVLCGAMIGFAPFNRPVARLFLGDVGSLPIGLLLGWLLVLLAGNGYLAAALLLPLYYLADATITLFRRMARGEPLMQAHRGHYYQHAFDHGIGAREIVGKVFMLNIALLAFALATLFTPSRLLHAVALAAGCVLVAGVLYRFSTAKA